MIGSIRENPFPTGCLSVVAGLGRRLGRRLAAGSRACAQRGLAKARTNLDTTRISAETLHKH